MARKAADGRFPSRLSRRIGLRPAARGVRNPATGPALPWPGTWADATAIGRPPPGGLSGVRGTSRNDFAGVRIVFADRILSDVDEPFAVHRHAVPLRRIEGTDDHAVLIDVDHGRWPHAAIGQRRSQLRLQLNVGQIVRAIEYPDVVVLIHRQSRDAPHLPFVRQRLRPIRIEFELRRGLLLPAQRETQKQQTRARQHLPRGFHEKPPLTTARFFHSAARITMPGATA